MTFIIDANGVVRAKFTPDQTLATEKSLSAASRQTSGTNVTASEFHHEPLTMCDQT